MIITERRDNAFNVGMMLMSLSGEVTEEEASTMLTLLQNPGGVSNSFIKILLRENFSPRFTREIWLASYKEPRGLQLAWKRVLRQVTFREFYIQPFKQSIACGFKIGAITGEITPELDGLIWKGVNGLFEAYDAKRIDPEILECMFRLWYGGEGVDENWGKLAARFEPDLRIPAAYLFGRRYLHPDLNRPNTARKFLEEAANNTRPEFQVEKKLAQEELRKLDRPKP
jgi:hypothetical protein